MSHYGISAIHWNVNLGEIDEVRLHEIIRDQNGAHAVTHAELAWCSDVISLIHRGNKVWVFVSVPPADSFKNTDHVRIGVNQHGHQYLYSCTRNGTQTSALTDLPRFQRPEDLER